MNFTQLLVGNTNSDTIYTYLKSKAYSENYLKNLRKGKYVKLNNEFVYLNTKVKNGDMLEIYNSPNPKSSVIACDIPLDIVYEDDYLLVVNKPSGLCATPNASHYYNNLSGAVLNYIHKKDESFVIRIINRLDKDTQGLVVFSKNAYMCTKLQKILNKKYHAIVLGNISDMTIDQPILTQKENGIIKIKRTVNANGKSAVTIVKVLEKFKNHTLIEVSLMTGRTHQIRVHLSNKNHPLLGDYIYGTISPLINHTALVCKEIHFVHPVTEKNIDIKIDYENAFKTALENVKSEL